jgi:DNA polymerase III epsilon subunit-like protein
MKDYSKYFRTTEDFFNDFTNPHGHLIFVDTETTGLGGAKVQQLTQISAIVINLQENEEIDTFDQMIELTDVIKERMEQTPEFPNGLDINGDGKITMNPWSTKKVLEFNHYYKGKNYIDEKEALDNFENWLLNFDNPTLVFQNAPFDMDMLCNRYGHKFDEYPIVDTKDMIQFQLIPIFQKLAETDTEHQKIINGIGTSKRDSGLISSSLGKIGPALGLDMSNYHNALSDCYYTFDVYKKLLSICEANIDLDIKKYQEERLETKKYKELA